MEIIFTLMRIVRVILFPSKEIRRESAERRRRALINKQLFTPGDEFLGKDIRYVVDRVGVYTFFGSMDHGKDIAQWRESGYMAELHFQNGLCVGVYVD